MAATRRSNHTALERVAFGGAVMFGAAYQLSSCFLPSPAASPNSHRPASSSSTALRGGHVPQTASAVPEKESTSVLCMAAGLVGLSTAALHSSRNLQKRGGQRDAVQRGIFKKIAGMFGSKPGTLRDGWQKLADTAKKVSDSGIKSNDFEKGQAKHAIAKAKKGEEVAKIEAAPLDYTLRDGWQALSDRAVEVYPKGLGSADTVAALKAAAPAVAAPAAAAATTEKTEAEKKPFDVFNPDTYGNITMDDVQKYGTAGTAAYVITELLFWAIALPAEVFIFYKTAGRWPDFEIDADKAAVFGFVFAASNIARALLPLRFGAALAIAPWVDENIINPGKKTTKETSS